MFTTSIECTNYKPDLICIISIENITSHKRWPGECYRNLQIYSLPFHEKNGNYYIIIVKVTL
jgi:hypothetical protein